MSTNKKHWTPEDKARFTEMCHAGASNQELAEAFGCSIFAVQHKRSTWGLTVAKCEAANAAAAEQTPPDEEETKDAVTIDAQTFFALAQEYNEKAEKIGTLSADNLALKAQLLDQSWIIRQLQDAFASMQDTWKSLQDITQQIVDHITDIEDEANNKSDYMARGGLTRLFRRYKPLKRLGTEDPDMKEAEDGGND